MKNFLNYLRRALLAILFVISFGLISYSSETNIPKQDEVIKELKENIKADYKDNFGDNGSSAHGG